MPLHDMPKRLVPFPLVLVAIVGFFALGVLYFDLRMKEARQEVNQPTNTNVVVDDYQPLQETPTSTSEGGENPPLTPTEPQLLGLPPEQPTSDVPATAVFDCWRYEWRGDRLIVDRDYRHIAGDGIEPMVGPDTAHLSCKDPQYALRAPSGNVTVYWSGAADRTAAEHGRPGTLETDTLYRIDAFTGELAPIVKLVGLDELTDYALVAFTPDESSIFLRADSSKYLIATLYRVTMTGDVRSYEYPNIWSPLILAPDQSRAVGFEYTAHGDLPEGAPVYLHRVNLATGARVRTKPITSVFDRMIPETNWQPVFIDNERLIMPGAPDAGGAARGATVVNVYTGKTARVPALAGTVELFALTVDGSLFYSFSDQMPLTAIPVAELPKP